MFKNCENFNQPLNKWNVSSVNDMNEMFNGCKKFNQNLNDWNISNVKNMILMFENTDLFNTHENAQWYNDQDNDDNYDNN